MAVFGIGSTGETVRLIQTKLKRWGFFDGEIDGIYGIQTFNAVKSFQEYNDLVPDGIAGSKTLEAMGIFLDMGVGGQGKYSERDVKILASAIYGEGRGEPYEGQVAIGGVILNRVENPKFPNTIPGVVYQRGAFDAVADGQINLEPNSIAYSAARDAISGWDPSDGALYYWNPVTATSQWIKTVPITKTIGRHVFGIK